MPLQEQELTASWTQTIPLRPSLGTPRIEDARSCRSRLTHLCHRHRPRPRPRLQPRPCPCPRPRPPPCPPPPLLACGPWREWTGSSDPCLGAIATENNHLLNLKMGIVNSDAALPSWNQSNMFSQCSYEGVSCTNQYVTSLNLAGKSLSGHISEHLYSLSYLTSIDLSNNFLSGMLPVSANQLSSLLTLSLNNNPISGTLPDYWYQMSQLTTLHLSQTQLSGTLPFSYGAMMGLREISLANNNKLSGTLSSGICSLGQLVTLSLASVTAMSGVIPPCFGNLAALRVLEAPNTKITGTLPPELASCLELRTLQLDANRGTEIVGISGTLPPALSNLSKLTFLSISGARLSGTLPLVLAILASLEKVLLNSNQISGALQHLWGTESVLWQLDLSNNKLSGYLETLLGDSVPPLKFLSLSGNRISGVLPESLMKLAPWLLELQVGQQNISGTLPAVAFQNMTHLTMFGMERTLVSGSIPAELVQPSLEVFTAENCLLEGPLPNIDGPRSLVSFRIDGNARLCGTLPTFLLSLPSLNTTGTGIGPFCPSPPPPLSSPLLSPSSSPPASTTPPSSPPPPPTPPPPPSPPPPIPPPPSPPPPSPPQFPPPPRTSPPPPSLPPPGLPAAPTLPPSPSVSPPPHAPNPPLPSVSPPPASNPPPPPPPSPPPPSPPPPRVAPRSSSPPPPPLARDETPPTVTFHAYPRPQDNRLIAMFRFSLLDFVLDREVGAEVPVGGCPGCTYLCQVDGRTLTKSDFVLPTGNGGRGTSASIIANSTMGTGMSCTPGVNFWIKLLAHGDHLLTITAMDSSGNTNKTSVSWTTRDTRPNVTLSLVTYDEEDATWQRVVPDPSGNGTSASKQADYLRTTWDVLFFLLSFSEADGFEECLPRSCPTDDPMLPYSACPSPPSADWVHVALGGSASAVQASLPGPGLAYEMERGRKYLTGVQPTSDGVVVVSVPSGLCIDDYGNSNLASATRVSIQIDASAPYAVEISTTDVSLLAVLVNGTEKVAYVASQAPLSFLVRFSEPMATRGCTSRVVSAMQAMTPLKIRNFSSLYSMGGSNVANPSLSSTDTSSTSGSSAIAFTFQLYPTPVRSVADAVSVVVNYGVCRDVAGNLNVMPPSGATAAADPFLLMFDGTPPVPDVRSLQGSEAATSPFLFQIRFTEVVFNFTLDGIAITGGNDTGDNATVLTSVGQGMYLLQVTPLTEHFVRVSVNSGAGSDLLGNPSTASNIAMCQHYTVSSAVSSAAMTANTAVAATAGAAAVIAGVGSSVGGGAVGATAGAGVAGAGLTYLAGHLQGLQQFNGLGAPLDSSVRQLTHEMRWLNYQFGSDWFFGVVSQNSTSTNASSDALSNIHNNPYFNTSRFGSGEGLLRGRLLLSRGFYSVGPRIPGHLIRRLLASQGDRGGSRRLLELEGEEKGVITGPDESMYPDGSTTGQPGSWDSRGSLPYHVFVGIGDNPRVLLGGSEGVDWVKDGMVVSPGGGGLRTYHQVATGADLRRVPDENSQGRRLQRQQLLERNGTAETGRWGAPGQRRLLGNVALSGNGTFNMTSNSSTGGSLKDDLQMSLAELTSVSMLSSGGLEDFVSSNLNSSLSDFTSWRDFVVVFIWQGVQFVALCVIHYAAHKAWNWWLPRRTLPRMLEFPRLELLLLVLSLPAISRAGAYAVTTKSPGLIVAGSIALLTFPVGFLSFTGWFIATRLFEGRVIFKAPRDGDVGASGEFGSLSLVDTPTGASGKHSSLGQVIDLELARAAAKRVPGAGAESHKASRLGNHHMAEISKDGVSPYAEELQSGRGVAATVGDGRAPTSAKSLAARSMLVIASAKVKEGLGGFRTVIVGSRREGEWARGELEEPDWVAKYGLLFEDFSGPRKVVTRLGRAHKEATSAKKKLLREQRESSQAEQGAQVSPWRGSLALWSIATRWRRQPVPTVSVSHSPTEAPDTPMESTPAETVKADSDDDDDDSSMSDSGHFDDGHWMDEGRSKGGRIVDVMGAWGSFNGSGSKALRVEKVKPKLPPDRESHPSPSAKPSPLQGLAIPGVSASQGASQAMSPQGPYSSGRHVLPDSHHDDLLVRMDTGKWRRRILRGGDRILLDRNGWFFTTAHARASYFFIVIFKDCLFAVLFGALTGTDGWWQTCLLTTWMIFHFLYCFVFKPFTDRMSQMIEQFSLFAEAGMVVCSVLLVALHAEQHPLRRVRLSRIMLVLAAMSTAVQLLSRWYDIYCVASNVLPSAFRALGRKLHKLPCCSCVGRLKALTLPGGKPDAISQAAGPEKKELLEEGAPQQASPCTNAATKPSYYHGHTLAWASGRGLDHLSIDAVSVPVPQQQPPQPQQLTNHRATSNTAESPRTYVKLMSFNYLNVPGQPTSPREAVLMDVSSNSLELGLKDVASPPCKGGRGKVQAIFSS
eukprot:jgi/Mesvir1/988/Mv17531-RA.1